MAYLGPALDRVFWCLTIRHTVATEVTKNWAFSVCSFTTRRSKYAGHECSYDYCKLTIYSLQLEFRVNSITIFVDILWKACNFHYKECRLKIFGQINPYILRLICNSYIHACTKKIFFISKQFECNDSPILYIISLFLDIMISSSYIFSAVENVGWFRNPRSISIFLQV